MSVNLSVTLDSKQLPPNGGQPTAEVTLSPTGKTTAQQRQIVLCVDTSA